MGSLLVRATFGERAAGIRVWQSGKRSSENGFQTTFWGGWEGKWFRRLSVCQKVSMRLNIGYGLLVICSF